MITDWLLPIHIAVLGYWLGAELVINSTFRYVCRHPGIAMPERNKLMDHVMHVDQHVRYALVLQASLGPAIAALYGYVPGGEPVAWAFLAFGAAWLAFVEIVHRLRHGPWGRRLALVDRGSRYLLMALLLAVAIGLVGAGWNMPGWLRLKMALFACVVMCGVGIRLALIALFRTWATIPKEGTSPGHEHTIGVAAWRGTAVVCLLWVFIAGIGIVSVWKP